MMKIKGLMEVILYVKDMHALVSFYRDNLGLRVSYPAGLQDYTEQFWVTLETGQCTLALHAGGQLRQGEDAPKIVFEVEDIKAAQAYLLEKKVKVSEIRSPAPGVWVVDGVDPEGNAFSLEAHT
jgi:predicted enzyme related to lactoylglutathione lyase